tara:strand:- start:7733 stop:7993 length:261 start_codon:yes stop_codon:yes gene_type:complete
MAITKQVEISQMTVLVDGQIQIQEKTSILEDGVELTSTFHRSVLDPARGLGDVTNQRIVDLVNLTWTPEVIQNRKDFIAQQEIGVA